MSAALSAAQHEGADLVGTLHRIGEIGPPYKVIDIAGAGQVRIMVLESGEIVDYPVSAARSDPEA
jgi:hypothetical protein